MSEVRLLQIQMPSCGNFVHIAVKETPVCRELLDEFIPPDRLYMILDMPPASREVQLQNAWNPQDTSVNIVVDEDDPLKFNRYPVAQSTDCIRGKIGFSEGLHVWEICWPTNQRGTNPVVGVATKDAPLTAIGYLDLVGSNDQSWGWNLADSRLYHNNQAIGKIYPKLSEKTLTPSIFYVVLDMDRGTLAFMVGDKYLGLAFSGLKGKTLYPVVNVVWGNGEVAMKYLNGLGPQALPLQFLCRAAIRKTIRTNSSLDRLDELSSIPPSIKKYLLYRN